MARWVELTVVVPRLQAEDAGAWLIGCGATGAQEDWLEGEAPAPRQPWDTEPAAPLPERTLLRAWWNEADWEQRRAEVEQALSARGWRAAGVGLLGEEAWADSWRDSFHPIRISDRLVIAPPWQASPGDLVIEPGMAFGTGEHATTRACLVAIDRLARPGGTCLDVGTGTGVLALAAAHLGMRARAVDTDPESVRAAGDNAVRNGLQIEVDNTPVGVLSGSYDLVVANLFAEVIIALAPDLERLTGGRLVLAGVLADRADRVVGALAGLQVVERRIDGDWVCLELSR